LTDERTEKHIRNAETYADFIGKAFMVPSGSSFVGSESASIMRTGVSLRDKLLYDYPILPGAVSNFQDLVSTREWTISGPPRIASRALDRVHNIRIYDPHTGLFEYGIHAALERRALDYLTLGVTVYARIEDKDGVHIEYLDPSRLSFERRNMRTTANQSTFNPVKPNDKVWFYEDGREFRAKDIFYKRYKGIGSRRHMQPLIPILPIATLAWLIREHDTASVDGRKLREILFVSNPGLHSAIENAIKVQVALHSGASVEEVGIPIVEINNPSGKAVQDQIAKLGISEIPTTFDRDRFEFSYANQIASALGLALRHFWNDERTTNRALEVVQEQRQQQKGPSAFVRVEQRILNASGFLEDNNNYLSPASRRVQFSFREEADTSGQKDRAEVLKATSEALKNIAEVFGARVDLDSFRHWMQSEGQLPYEFELLKEDDGEAMQTTSEAYGSDGRMTTGEEVNRESDPAIVGDREKSMDYGDIVIDMNGRVLDRRRKVFHLPDMIPPVEADDFAETVLENSRIERFRDTYSNDTNALNNRISEVISDKTITFEKAWNVATDCLLGNSLDEEQQRILELLL
jgi:hypothetical protein